MFAARPTRKGVRVGGGKVGIDDLLAFTIMSPV